ncbi:MAG: methyltransferase family protein [Acidimicrobiia bacterium]
MNDSGRRSVAFGIVAVQGILLAAFLAVPGGEDWAVPRSLSGLASALQVAGWFVLVVALVGLGRSLTVLPTPAKRSTLKTTGLYRFVRHPIYSGVLAIVLGGAAASGRVLKLALALALVALLTGKARWEEDMLRRRYTAYDDYAHRTPGFLPRLPGGVPGRSRRRAPGRR